MALLLYPVLRLVLLLVLDPPGLLALVVPVALLPVCPTEATARALATATPDTTAPHLLVPEGLVLAPAILKTHMVLLARVRTPQVQAALTQLLMDKRRTPRALDRLRRVDTLRHRTVDMDDLPRAPLVILKDRMANPRLPRGTKHGGLGRDACYVVMTFCIFSMTFLFLVIHNVQNEIDQLYTTICTYHVNTGSKKRS